MTVWPEETFHEVDRISECMQTNDYHAEQAVNLPKNAIDTSKARSGSPANSHGGAACTSETK